MPKNGENRRVVHKQYGAGEILEHTFIGPAPVAVVKFDSEEDEMFVAENELSPEIPEKERKESNVEIDDELQKELDEIRAAGLKEAKEIEKMNDETLLEAFEHLIRNGAGPGFRGVVFMKREMLKRMKKENT